MVGVVDAVRRRVGEVLDRLLAPADGVAPAAAGTSRPPIASMPESSGQGA